MHIFFSHVPELKGASLEVPHSVRRLLLSLVVLIATLVPVACSSQQSPASASQPTTTPEPVVVLTVEASVLIDALPSAPFSPVTDINITPGTVVLDTGLIIQLQGEAVGKDGGRIDDAQLVWNSVDVRAGAVTEKGEFRAGLVPGSYPDAIAVTAIQNSPDGIVYFTKTATVTIVGEARPSTLSSVSIFPNQPTLLTHQIYRLRAVAFDQDGLLIPAANLVWRVNDPALGHINPLGYLTVEGEPGTYHDSVTVTAVWDGVTASETASVEVVTTQKAKDSLSVQALPQNFYLDPGDKLQLRAVAINGLGELISGTELRWSVILSDAGTIDGRGLFVAGANPGVYTEAVKVEAIVPGESGYARAEDYASVVVRDHEISPRLAAIQVVPRTVIAAPDGRVLLVAQPLDEQGAPARDITLSWATLNGQVGEVDVNGSFKASGVPGIYKDALQVTVQQLLEHEIVIQTQKVDVIITGTLTSVGIRPTLATVSPGKTIHFDLNLRDEFGTPLSGLSVEWSVSNPEIGSIDGFGNFTAGKIEGLFENAIRAVITQTLSP